MGLVDPEEVPGPAQHDGPRSGDAGVIDGYYGSSNKLDNALAKFAKTYADQTESDFEQFKKAIAKGRLRAVIGE